MSRLSSITVTLSIAVGVAACATPKPQAVSTPHADVARAVPPRAADPTQSVATVEVSESIRRACGLTDTEAFFAYDSARLSPGAHPSLDLVATCFISGPLAGRQMDLVGHADPRGDSEYNMLLGERRAQTVDDALSARRLPQSQMSTTSRGEMDATGTDEATWAHDRRVQLELED